MNVRGSAANGLYDVSSGSWMFIAKSAPDTRSTPYLPAPFSPAPLGDFKETRAGLWVGVDTALYDP